MIFLPFDCFPNRLLSAVAPRSPSRFPATDALGVPSCCSPTAVHIKGIKKIIACETISSHFHYRHRRGFNPWPQFNLFPM